MARQGTSWRRNRIGAIARDLVDHYIDDVFPDGFKAQVVCHPKLAAGRYQKAIRLALAERLERERLKSKPDVDLIRRIGFLKAAVDGNPTTYRAARTDRSGDRETCREAA